jgi:hypothetical protein
MPTQPQIDRLKEQWTADPCFEIENTPGFEDVSAYLKAFREDCEAKWEAQYQAKLRDYAGRVGLDTNLKLAEHVRTLEEQISRLMDVVREAGLHP